MLEVYCCSVGVLHPHGTPQSQYPQGIERKCTLYSLSISLNIYTHPFGEEFSYARMRERVEQRTRNT